MTPALPPFAPHERALSAPIVLSRTRVFMLMRFNDVIPKPEIPVLNRRVDYATSQRGSGPYRTELTGEMVLFLIFILLLIFIV